MTFDTAPQPNRGGHVSDLVRDGPGQQKSLAEWKLLRNCDGNDQIKLVKLAHMRYRHPDLGAITEFLQDFGMYAAKRTETEVWFRGYGPDPYAYYVCKGEKEFLGGAFIVESYQDLERASALESGAPIKEMKYAPGKGDIITVHDPEGFPVSLIHGQEPVNSHQPPPKITSNYAQEEPRIREFLRFKPGPAAVHKLGHYGLCVRDFQVQVEFYLTNFNIVPTDSFKSPSLTRLKSLLPCLRI